MIGLPSEVIVCTRNRPEDIARLLESLSAQGWMPRVMFVDSSDGDETMDLVQAWLTGAPNRGAYCRSEPGLARQRMAGVLGLSSDTRIVHFIDDDVVLEAGYFSAIETAFANDQVVGVQGLVIDAPPHRVSGAAAFFLLDSRREGIVLTSGMNIVVYDATAVREVEWLSGCCMSYRRHVLESLSFDTRMTGYSLGEDLDFSYRVGKSGRLLVAPAARLRHLRSPVDRLDVRRLTTEQVVWRHSWVSELRGFGVSRRAFWWSAYGDLLLSTISGYLRGDEASVERARGLRDGIARVLGSPSVPRNPRLGTDRIGGTGP